MDDVIVKSVLFMRTTKDIWDDLEERFRFPSVAQIYSLEQQLLDVKQGSNTVSEFFTKIKTIWDGIDDVNPLSYCTCTKFTCDLTQRIRQKQEDQKILQFMMKLNEKFSTIRGNILMMHRLPNISQIQALIQKTLQLFLWNNIINS